MKNNGDIVRFFKDKEYIMLDNDLGGGSFGKTVLLKTHSLMMYLLQKNMSQHLVMKTRKKNSIRISLMRLRSCISLTIII